MKNFYEKNEFYFAYGFGLFMGYCGGSNGNYLEALVYGSFVIIVLLALRWIFIGPPILPLINNMRLALSQWAVERLRRKG